MDRDDYLKVTLSLIGTIVAIIVGILISVPFVRSYNSTIEKTKYIQVYPIVGTKSYIQCLNSIKYIINKDRYGNPIVGNPLLDTHGKIINCTEQLYTFQQTKEKINSNKQFIEFIVKLYLINDEANYSYQRQKQFTSG
jgi:hypothetical protein